MASKKTLNAKNLESLGTSRLAELLIEISMGSATAKRHLRLELTGAASPQEVAPEIRKRLNTIARARSFINWQKRKILIADLEIQRRAIVEQVAKTDATEALDLIWRFMALADSILDRCDDRSGTVIGVFQTARQDLGEVATAARADPKRLAKRAFQALEENHYGLYDRLIETLAPTLGPAGLDHLQQLFTGLLMSPSSEPREKDPSRIGWCSSGLIDAETFAAQRRDHAARRALREIADAQGDVDAYIALQSEAARTAPGTAAEIAGRLLAADRKDEAWEAINAIDQQRADGIPLEWERTRLEVLEALGKRDEAQAFRRACFERSLTAEHLRAYLKRLADFDDLEAEERALSLAERYPDVHRALTFLTSWPAIERAAELVFARTSEIDGNRYEILAPAADALDTKNPLASTLLRRAMIDFSLKNARVKRYRHAARHLQQCESAAGEIADFQKFEKHETYLNQLRAKHGRKTSFWRCLT